MNATKASTNRKSNRTINVRASKQTFDTLKIVGIRYRLSTAATLEAIVEHFDGMREDEQIRALFKTKR